MASRPAVAELNPHVGVVPIPGVAQRCQACNRGPRQEQRLVVSATYERALQRRCVINHTEKALCGGSCQNSFGVKALHIFQRRLHGSEAISDHVPFVGSEDPDEVYLSTGPGNESSTKRRGVAQSGIGADAPEWRHIVKRVASFGSGADLPGMSGMGQLSHGERTHQPAVASHVCSQDGGEAA